MAQFTLLETIFSAFDQIAKRRRVFKVETVGDCYVAAAGLPEPRKDHATVMVSGPVSYEICQRVRLFLSSSVCPQARFATDCLNAFGALAKDLEVALGPDTGMCHRYLLLLSFELAHLVILALRCCHRRFGDSYWYALWSYYSGCVAGRESSVPGKSPYE